jgi:hypothetical protein
VFDLPQTEQAGPPTPVESAQPAGPRDIPIALVTVPKVKCATSDDGDIVVCGRRNDEQYRLRPLSAPASDPDFLQKPHVIRLGPNVRIGFLGNGKGVGLEAEF